MCKFDRRFAELDARSPLFISERRETNGIGNRIQIDSAIGQGLSCAINVDYRNGVSASVRRAI